MKKLFGKKHSETGASGSGAFSDVALLAIAIVAAIVVTVLTVYLTPLKHLNIIDPVSNDVDPAVFYADYKVHPENYMFIDVRSPNIYDAAHARGASNMPIENMIDEHFALPKTGKKIALICTSGRLAGIAYGYLENWGFLNLIRIKGGLENWALEGLPVDGKSIPKDYSKLIDEHQ